MPPSNRFAMMRGMGAGRDKGKRETVSKRFFYGLLGLAGLGVGVWLFRSQRRKRRPRLNA